MQPLLRQLRALKLDMYVDSFEAAGFALVSDLSKCPPEELAKLTCAMKPPELRRIQHLASKGTGSGESSSPECFKPNRCVGLSSAIPNFDLIWILRVVQLCRKPAA